MNSTDILRTSSKVFGLWFILQAVMNLRDIFFYLAASTSYSNEGIFMILGSQAYTAIFNIVVGLILIAKADWVTEKIKPQSTEKLNINLDKKDWLELSLVVISGLTILYSVPEILHKFANYIYFNDHDVDDRQYFWTNKNKAEIFYSIFKFAVGLFFLLNARNFAVRLKKIGDRDDKLGE